jgi:hypothetical protein
MAVSNPRFGDCGFGPIGGGKSSARVTGQAIGPVLAKFGMTLNTQTGT